MRDKMFAMCWGDRAGLQRELKASYDESKLIQRHYCGESETLVQYATCTTRSWTSSAAYNRDIVKKDISEQTFGTYQAPLTVCAVCSAPPRRVHPTRASAPGVSDPLTACCLRLSLQMFVVCATRGHQTGIPEPAIK